jgi:hypothetical protein
MDEAVQVVEKDLDERLKMLGTSRVDVCQLYNAAIERL